MVCLGSNAHGQKGGVNDQTLPGPEISFGDKIIQISSASFHTCALLESGQATCWGLNRNGQLGQGDTNNWPVGSAYKVEDLRPIDFGREPDR